MPHNGATLMSKRWGLISKWNILTHKPIKALQREYFHVSFDLPTALPDRERRKRKKGTRNEEEEGSSFRTPWKNFGGHHPLKVMASRKGPICISLLSLLVGKSSSRCGRGL